MNKMTDRLGQYPMDSYCDTNEEWFANKPMERDYDKTLKIKVTCLRYIAITVFK
jgi:hypothetical protein